MNKTLAVAVAALVLAVVAFAFPRAAERVVETVTLGAMPGPEFSDQVVTRGLTQGGLFTISTTSSALTLRDQNLKNNSVIYVSSMGAGQAALALTLPASTTWPSLVGVQSWVIDASAVVAATTTTVTAGTGVDIDGTTANDDVINGAATGVLTCWRLTAEGNNVRCIVEEMVDAG